MNWRIVLTPTARSLLAKIRDRRVSEKISERIDALAQVPDEQGKPLTGELTGYRAVRAVGQRYRVLYKVKRDEVLVQVVALGLRQEGGKRDVYALALKLMRLGLLNPPRN